MNWDKPLEPNRVAIDSDAPPTDVISGSKWSHHSGRIYTVLFIANHVIDPKPDYPPMVIYQGENGKKWAGQLDDWHRRMTLIKD